MDRQTSTSDAKNPITVAETSAPLGIGLITKLRRNFLISLRAKDNFKGDGMLGSAGSGRSR